MSNWYPAPPPQEEDDAGFDETPQIRRVGAARPVWDDEDEAVEFVAPPVRVHAREAATDPTLGLLLAFALCIGLIPTLPNSADIRYMVCWSVLLVFAAFAWLLGTTERVGRERIENLVWGVGFGLFLAVPLLIVGGSTLAATVGLLFRTEINEVVQPLPLGATFALLVFVQPMAESLFFRGQFQYDRAIWLVGGMSSLWSILLFLPMINIGSYPIIAVLISIALILTNMLYAYVRQRNGLAAAWLCQATVNIALLFVPYVISQ